MFVFPPPALVRIPTVASNACGSPHARRLMCASVSLVRSELLFVPSPAPTRSCSRDRRLHMYSSIVHVYSYTDYLLPFILQAAQGDQDWIGASLKGNNMGGSKTYVVFKDDPEGTTKTDAGTCTGRHKGPGGRSHVRSHAHTHTQLSPVPLHTATPPSLPSSPPCLVSQARGTITSILCTPTLLLLTSQW